MSRRLRVAVASASATALLMLAPGPARPLAASSASAATPQQQFTAALQQAQRRAAARRRPSSSRRALRRLARSAPRTPRAVERRLASRRPGGRARAAATTAPPWPMCRRGNNGVKVDPKASGACLHNMLAPTGGATPKGTVIMVAGGGWLSGSTYVSDPQLVAQATTWRDAGYQVILVEHTSGVVNGVSGLGSTGYTNVVQWYDLLRFYSTSYFGTSYPVCAAGGSSGGHFALMLAVVRLPSCISTNGAPTDLPATQGYNDGVAHTSAARAFGAANLRQWSPVAYPTAPYFQMPVAMAHLQRDYLVPLEQMTAFAAGRPSVRALTLESDDRPCTDYKLWISLGLAHLCLGGQPGVAQVSVDLWRELQLDVIGSVTLS